MFDAWASIESAVRTGRPSFDTHHRVSWVEYYRDHARVRGCSAPASAGAQPGRQRRAVRPARGHRAPALDLNMLAVTGGRERTARNSSSCSTAADLTVERISPTDSPLSVIVTAPTE
jgi:hypothetical protein